MPPFSKLFDNLPNLDARLGVKPGGRLVEKNDLRFSHKAHGDVEPAAHTARIGGNPAVGGVGQAEAVQQIVRNLTRIFEVPQPGDHDKIFPPGQNLVHGGKLPGQTDRLPHIVGSLTQHRIRLRVAVPPSCLSSVVRILIIVVLPAPLEPSRAKILPLFHLEIHAL